MMKEHLRISPAAWAATIVGVLLATAGICVMALRGHEHVTEGRYLGPGRCAECHEEQARAWAETRMAKTFDALRPGAFVKEKEGVGLDPDHDYTREEACLPCHTTGYGKTGGFVSLEETPEMAGVTCEACHGPGGVYADSVMSRDNVSFQTSQAREAGLVYPPTARVCRVCHNEDSPFVGMDYKFDYEERVKRGTHEHFPLKYEHR